MQARFETLSVLDEIDCAQLHIPARAGSGGFGELEGFNPCSLHDGLMRESFDPSPEEQNVVLIGSLILHQAEKLIAGCESCSPDDAEIPFDNGLDQVTGNDPAVTDYILSEPATCPHCKRDITEKTLVELAA